MTTRLMRTAACGARPEATLPIHKEGATKMRPKTTAIATALLGLCLGLPASAADKSAAAADKPAPATHISTSPMTEFENSDRVPGAGAHSVLRRANRWVEVQIDTNGVDPSTPYTVWAVIFNKPQYCASSPCGLGDLPISPGHDPRLQASLAYVTGGFSDADGTLRLSGRLDRAWSGVKPTETLFGPGLLYPNNAEIHFVLRGHGQEFGNPLLSIGSYNGGCTEANPCGDHQATVHLPN
jgi:hypothetical protein